MRLFLYGSLRDPALLATVTGRLPPARPAQLAGHVVLTAVNRAGTEAFPMILPEHGAVTEGLLVEGLTAAEIDRLRFYEAGFTLDGAPVTLEMPEGPVQAALFRPQDPGWISGGLWDFADWRARWGETSVAAARAFMAEYGLEGGAERAARRWTQLLVRGGAEVRARETAPVTLRRAQGADDIRIGRLSRPYANYFAVEEYDLSWRRFDGAMSREANRAVFVSGDAVIVLPYDPVRDRVHLIEQFRVGAMARGDAEPWLVETIAGRIDGGESPEEAARREAAEEAGLTLTRLLRGPSCYASPGALSEYLYHYVAVCDLPDAVVGTGGLEAEEEDIRSHVLPFARFMELLDSGEIDNAPLVILAMWLDRLRPQLRAEAGLA
ncbi:NUDIX domain-containing protein [Frigidibacter sp. MR17.14]|uniref:NUDIX domain-containing protein n=1 Tax=Frigidibacter sp. MR17.14 TaxID=3126509 RepID=UPI003012B2FC